MKFVWALTSILVITFIESAEFCQNVEQRFKFRNTDVYVRLVRSEKLQYQIMKGKTNKQITDDLPLRVMKLV